MLLWRERSIPLAMGMMLTIALIMLSWVMIRSAQAGQDIQHINETVPFTDLAYNPCPLEDDDPTVREVVTYEGTIHYVGTVSYDSTGESHYVGHTNLHAEGVGDSGGKYVLSGGDNVTSSGSGDWTIIMRYHVQRQGETGTPDDYIGTAVIHQTINANEIVVTSFDLRNVQCTPASA